MGRLRGRDRRDSLGDVTPATAAAERLSESAPAAVRADGEERLLTGWGRAAGTRAHVLDPADADGVRSALDGAGARGVIPRGLGRAYPLLLAAE